MSEIKITFEPHRSMSRCLVTFTVDNRAIKVWCDSDALACLESGAATSRQRLLAHLPIKDPENLLHDGPQNTR